LDLTNIINGSKNNHPYAGKKTKPILLQYILDNLVVENMYNILKCLQNEHSYLQLYTSIFEIQAQIGSLGTEIKNVNNFLDASIFGHKKAKSKINKIIGQWITGDQTGYCFGFEGSPGIGKTSLAKRGLAECLRDENGNSRPFAFIAMGGSCNGSTLEGHNYTYVNSTWGKIVDILMESKCMNPIIYIDELDKVSKTEQGRELIGILTHLTDTTQNDEFQDKYFSGIPIDLSKVLFIFSYNDPEQVDRILLDRIHRIKFDNLSWTDKLVIVRDFILPELNKKMGFDNTVILDDIVIEHLIEQYTMEPGVRKLKELLFDIYGEINVSLLSENVDKEHPFIFPIHVNVQDLGTKYLKSVKKIQEKQIHSRATVGMINGMWANNLGKGGIIPIETMFYPSGSFLELRLTGLQGDVMKESMNVAKTLAWSLTPVERQKVLFEEWNTSKNQGLHIHCPEGAVSKDGPSAGTAIAVSIYSLLNNKPIKNDISITGEIDLHGNVTAIGGLESKILGSIRAGVKIILYPKANKIDFDEFYVKYNHINSVQNTIFYSIENIIQAIQYSIE
jgi:ATP-dependent Lon protease